MDIPGLPARRAALSLLDAVLRRGETLDQTASAALRRVRGEPDKALARAIAGEVLRWKQDLDVLIDSATRQRLPDDAKPRQVLAMMLAQWLRFDTPPHAVIATGLPLLTGGPRRLAHGVFSTLVKRAASLPRRPDPARGGASALGRTGRCDCCRAGAAAAARPDVEGAGSDCRLGGAAWRHVAVARPSAFAARRCSVVATRLR